MPRSSRAGSRKRTFSAEEAAELMMEAGFEDKDDDEDFDDFLTVAEFTGEKDSSDDHDQPADLHRVNECTTLLLAMIIHKVTVTLHRRQDYLELSG